MTESEAQGLGWSVKKTGKLVYRKGFELAIETLLMVRGMVFRRMIIIPAVYLTGARYLNGSVSEDAVSDDIVVVEVSADDRRSKMNNNTTDVDHQYAEHGTAETASVLGRRGTGDGVVACTATLGERVRFTADHRNDVEPRRRHDHHVRSIQQRNDKLY